MMQCEGRSISEAAGQWAADVEGIAVEPTTAGPESNAA